MLPFCLAISSLGSLVVNDDGDNYRVRVQGVGDCVRLVLDEMM